MERDACKSHIFPHAKDKLFDKARQAIDSLPSSAFYNSQFDYILFTKKVYCGEKLTKTQKDKAMGYVLGAYTERMWREVRLKGEDRDTFYAEQIHLVRHIFGSIDCFQSINDKDWRDIAEFYIRLSIMKEIMRKPNIRFMGHGAALSIGMTSALSSGNPSLRVQRLVNVLHHVIDKKTYTSRSRRDASFTAKRRSVKKRDYVLTSKENAVSAHRTSTKITTFAIKEEGSVLIKREKKGRSSMIETVSQSPMTPQQEEFSFEDALELLCATEFAEMTDLSETSLVQCGGDGHFDTLRLNSAVNMEPDDGWTWIGEEIDFDEAWGENDQTPLLESLEAHAMEVMEGASDNYFTRAAHAIGQTIYFILDIEPEMMDDAFARECD